MSIWTSYSARFHKFKCHQNVPEWLMKWRRRMDQNNFMTIITIDWVNQDLFYEVKNIFRQEMFHLAFALRCNISVVLTLSLLWVVSYRYPIFSQLQVFNWESEKKRINAWFRYAGSSMLRLLKMIYTITNCKYFFFFWR